MLTINKDIPATHFLLAALVLGPSVGLAQTQIIPQIADGGAWQTTLVLTNTSASPAPVGLIFFEEIGGGMTQSWNLQFQEVSSTQNLTLPAAGTLILHTQDNPFAATSTGWAQMQAGPAVSAYAIFTLRVTGRQDQDGTAPAAPTTSRVLVPFDNSNGFVTTIAIANPTLSNDNILVGIQPVSGPSSHPASFVVPGQGHMAFALPAQFSGANGVSGTLELYSVSGSFSVLALRFNPTGAFTAAPVYSESGPPVI